jgi:acyl carrier protein
MGLDTVELVMRVESDFNVEIPDDVASTLEAVGMLHLWLVAELERVSGQPQNSVLVYEKLKALIIDQTRVKPHLVTPVARFVKDLKLD